MTLSACVLCASSPCHPLSESQFTGQKVTLLQYSHTLLKQRLGFFLGTLSNISQNGNGIY